MYNHQSLAHSSRSWHSQSSILPRLQHRKLQGLLLLRIQYPRRQCQLVHRCQDHSLKDTPADCVSGASILSFAPSTHKRRMKLEFPTQPGGSQSALTLGVVHNVQVNLLKNHLVITFRSEPVLSPASCIAGSVVTIGLVGLWQTNSVNMEIKNKVFCQKYQSKIVGQVLGIKFRVNFDILTISVLVRIGLSWMLGVPFSAADLQLAGVGLKLVDTVGCCKDYSGRNEGASALVQVYRVSIPFRCFVQHSAHVRPFSKL